MYTPPPFKSDRAASLAFAEARGFGHFCAWDGNKPVASSLPFYLTSANDGTPRAAFHVARHNPLVKLADGTTSWLLAVNGADAYVSPDWYVSPRESSSRCAPTNCADSPAVKSCMRYDTPPDASQDGDPASVDTASGRSSDARAYAMLM